jgi:Tfp pilus assembly protein PilN
MAEINLIPPNAKKGSQQTVLSRKITRTLVLLFVAFVIIASVGGGFLYTKTQELKTKQADLERLKNEALSLQQNEGSLVLLRDRLEKLQIVLEERLAYDKLAIFKDKVTALPAGSQLSELKIETGLYEIAISTPDSNSLQDIVESVKVTQGLENITIREITYNETSGYTVVFSVL